MQTYTSTISSQNQVTIPAGVRKRLGLSAGKVLVWQLEQSVLGVPQAIAKPGTVEALRKLRGVAGDLYRKRGGGKQVLSIERDAWDR